MKKLFGTDGIRGLANEYPMTAEMALRVGRVVATYFAGPGKDPIIIIGRDTRLSGDMLESGMVAGICAAGGNAYLTGVLPTPGVAFAASSFKAIAGIVISASYTINASIGMRSRCKRLASIVPTTVFPDPRIPISTIFFSMASMRFTYRD